MTTITIDRALLEQTLQALVRTYHYGGVIAADAECITALRAALAQQAEPDAYGYASRLAVAIWEKHYKDIAPQWKPLDDLVGVLTQIDNMVAGMTRLAQQAEPVEPVAWLYEAGTDRTLHWYKPPLHGTPLYTAPPKLLPLTDEEIDALPWNGSPRQLARAVERALEEKNRGR